METLGKVISLIIITLFGAGTAVVHILEDSGSKVLDSIDEQSVYLAKPDAEVEFYRKQIRKNMSFEVDKNSAGRDTKQNYLWSESQNYYTDKYLLDSKTRPEIVELAKNSSFRELKTEMEYWYKRYNTLIKNMKNKQEAKDAYNKYRIYKEALKMKRAYN